MISQTERQEQSSQKTLLGLDMKNADFAGLTIPLHAHTSQLCARSPLHSLTSLQHREGQQRLITFALASSTAASRDTGGHRDG